MRARSFSLVVLLLASTTIHLMLTEELNHLIEEPTVHRTSSPTDPVVEFYQATDPVRQLETSTSGRFTCYVTKAGSLHCWGDNDNSNLGDGTTTDRREPVIPSGMQSNVSMVALGLGHACALMDNGTVHCWGANAYGQLGVGDQTSRSTPTQTSSLGVNRTAVAISAGDSHTCAILDDGTVKCWGDGGNGRLGVQNNWISQTPTATSSLGAGRTARSISLGAGHSCALLDDFSVKCWGLNLHGQVGIGSTNNNIVSPSLVSFGTNRKATSIAAAGFHTCATLNDGNTSCWGYNNYGELGINTTTSHRTPQIVDRGGVHDSFRSLTGGYRTTCGVLTSGLPSCWGLNTHKGIGDGTDSHRYRPVLVSNLSNGDDVQNITAGRYFTCASFTDGSIRCWGDNTDEALGISYLDQSLSKPNGRPIGAKSLVRVAEIVEDQTTSLLVRTLYHPGTNLTLALPTGLNLSNDGLNVTGRPVFTTQTTWMTASNASPTFTTTVQLEVLRDTDADGIANKYDNDDDGDLVGDDSDVCPIEWGNATLDRRGCPDTDGDGMSNSGDSFPIDPTQTRDSDQDGFGDNMSGFRGDNCPQVYGESRRGQVFGCPDADYDGWDDGNDSFPQQSSQWNDTDGDGYGDEFSGFQGDECPNTFGNSTLDRFGCVDGDGDGTSDQNDAFPTNPTQVTDRDGDGHGDNQDSSATQSDTFPSDGTQWEDLDGDGFGDNPNGTNGDKFLGDATRWSDRDGDGYADQLSEDAFPLDPTQWNDSDGDGYGDNPNGNNPDLFVNDSNEWKDTDGDGFGNNGDWAPSDGTQWEDLDGDGYGDNPNGTNGDRFLGDATRWSDTDGDGHSNQQGDDAFINDPTQWEDADGDGFGDNPNGSNPDAFSNDSSEWKDTDGDGVGDNADWARNDGTQWNDSDGDGFGDNPNGTNGDKFPGDANRWSDRDGDGYADQLSEDAFPLDPTQWNDSDGDGYGDNPNGSNPDAFTNDSSEWKDNDGDGYGDNADRFPFDGSQWSDADEDGFGDNPNGTNADRFPEDPLRWRDTDLDGITDVEDAFVNDPSQSSDQDGDGFGDDPNGTKADRFPEDPTEWSDRDEDGVGDNSDAFPSDGTQWNDTDGDGFGDNPVGNLADRFPNDPMRWSDRDGDGYADQLSEDAFPDDTSQWLDRDGDGFGDNANGSDADAFPDDPTEWDDTDRDGLGDNSDRFAFDPSQTLDSDGDGYGDNPRGNLPDAFPNDPSQWVDIDGDGFGDNPTGSDPDAFPNDPTQWTDRDGDGFGDNLAGRLADLFPDNPTQSVDADGDGLGDNQSGTDADPYLDDADNDGYNDSVDLLPNFASPGDLDADGCPDDEDVFPSDASECTDFDQDGVGDNGDTDDDNDGWSDTDEIRLGADPLQSSTVPTESFEVVVPGTAVGLGAWDLIGIFGGGPVFVWILFGFLTRRGRTERFEERLRMASSREELEEIATHWEYALMIRLIGPHQGIRLERLRAELDDRFELAQTGAGSSESATIEGAKQLVPIRTIPDATLPATQTADGYEWLDHEGEKFYRTEGSDATWEIWES